MLIGSAISVILILFEVSVALAVVIYFARKKLTVARQHAKVLGHALEEERSAKTFRGKLKDFFEQEIKRTSARYDELIGKGNVDSEKSALLLTRKNALNIEKKASQKNPLDSDYWENLQRGYAGFVPQQPQLDSQAVIEDLSQPQPIAQKAHSGGVAAVAVNRAACEELGRLRNVINNQYDSIDALKRQLLEIDSDDVLADHPIIADLHQKISHLVADQDQMSMCVKVLEGENERLMKSLAELQQQRDIEPALQGLEYESKDVTELTQELKKAEELARDLLRTNKEQLQCITTLESELELKHNIELGSDQADMLKTLQDTKLEVKQLNQEKLKNLAYIEQLRNEVESLRAITAKNAANSNSDAQKNIEKQLHAKSAELELLREEYQSMHEKYIKLYQDKAS